MTRRVAVIGGGISGLTAAYFLEQRGYAATVFEAAERCGGKIQSGEVDGITVEDGPDALLPRDGRPIELLRELGLADQLVSPAIFGAYIWCDGMLRRLPLGSPYGIPRSPYAAFRSGLLSPLGAMRASLERWWPRKLSGPDTSIGAFVQDRFGSQVARRMVDPLLAGVRGGRLENISMAAAAPDVDALARSHRSVTTALRAQGPPESPVFVTPRAGMGSLTDRLIDRLPDVRINGPVERMGVAKGHVEVDRSSESYDAAVVAVPTFVAARVLEGIEPTAAKLLHTIEYASTASIALVYPPGSVRVPSDGSGFLVPSDSDLGVSACTWYSSKWPTIGADGRIVVRAVVGRSGTDRTLDLDDEALVERVHHDLHEVMRVSSPPLATRVTRWERSIPQYAVGHLELVSKIEARLAAAGPVYITGAGYRGSGIPDCIAQAHATAAEIDARLGNAGG